MATLIASHWMKVRSYSGTDRGIVRATNEDALLLADDLGLFAVCDGVGGRVGGDVASSRAAAVIESAVRGGVDRLRASRRSSEPLTAHHARLHALLQASFQRASEDLIALGAEQPHLQGLCTTASALLVDGEHALLAHTGDSRIYRLRGHTLEQLTHDHTLAAWAEEGGVPSASASRLSGLTDAIGVGLQVRVDLERVDLRAGDRFFLCTDGVHAHRGDDPALLDLVGGPPETVIPRAIELARSRDSDDNVTAALLVCGI